MNIIELKKRMTKIMKILKIHLKKNENHENIIIPLENHENHEILEFHLKITNIMNS